MKEKISILLPSRGRTQPLLDSIDSLLTTANKPERIEILLAIDNDDIEVLSFVHSAILPRFQNVKLFVTAPLGYGKLTAYYNTLAGLAHGYWIMIWNDDAKMLNKGWDIEIDSYSEHPMPVLKMPVKDFEHAFALFPIVTKNWISVFGCLSLYKDLDRFTYNVACNTADGIFLKLNSTILHDRADITGNNNDATYAASKQVYISTDPSSPFSDDYPMAIRILEYSVNKLRYWLNKTYGYNLPLIDPNEKTEWQHVNAGTSHK